MLVTALNLNRFESGSYPNHHLRFDLQVNYHFNEECEQLQIFPNYLKIKH